MEMEVIAMCAGIFYQVVLSTGWASELVTPNYKKKKKKLFGMFLLPSCLLLDFPRENTSAMCLIVIQYFYFIC